MIELKAAYPYGEQMCAVAIPGNNRAVAAQGATLAIVDTTTFDQGEPKELQSIEIPGVSPMAMRYRYWLDGSTERRAVFIAGGTTGVWRVSLCNDLFTSSAPPPCSTSAEFIERVGCEMRFAFKRCVDVEIVEGNPAVGGDGLLLALFAASSQHAERVSMLDCPTPGNDLGGTEIRAYRLTPAGGILPYAQYKFSTANIAAPSEEVGMAIATDPGDPGRVFVSLGAGGIWRVQLNVPFAATRVDLLPIPTCSLPSCPQGEQVRDLAVVRLSTGQARLFAALEYGRVVDMDPDVAGSATAFPLGEAFPMRIAAAVVPGDNVVVGVVLDQQSGVGLDSTSPYRPVGVWWGMCVIPGLPEWNDIANLSKATKLRILSRSPASALADVGAIQTSTRPGSVEILPTSNPNVVRLYASTSVEGLQSIRLSFSSGTAWTVSNLWAPPSFRPFRGKAFDAADVYLSGLDDTLILGGFDGWDQDHPGRIARIDLAAGVNNDILPIGKTVSACASRDEVFPTVNCFPPTNIPKHVDPVPFILGVAGVAMWPDPFDPLAASEWILAGHDTNWWATTNPTCAFEPDSVRCSLDPCTAGLANSPWAEGRAIIGCATTVGWQLRRMRTLAPTTGPFDGTTMAPKFWQLPSNNPSGATPDTTRSITAPYTSCVADLRTWPVGPSSVEVPWFVHLARNGALGGYKIVRPIWLMDRALGVVSGSPAGGAACPINMRGFGETLGSAATQSPWPGQPGDLEMMSITTHLELATTGCLDTPQIIKSDCFATSETGLETSRRFAFNHSAHAFTVRNSQQQDRWIVAVAAGFVTSSGPTNCPWRDYYRRAFVLFYDVTGLDPSQPVTSQSVVLKAAAVGPPLDQEPQLPSSDQASHAFAVKTRTYSNGQTLAFVADLLGRVLIYDVSWDKLTTVNPPSSVPMPGQASNPLLLPYAQHRFTQDPFDGKRPNCVALEVNDEALYCATARGGLQVLESMP